jgi:hypothetical protein
MITASVVALIVLALAIKQILGWVHGLFLDRSLAPPIDGPASRLAH